MLNFLDLPYMAPHPVVSSNLNFVGKSLTIQKIIKNSSDVVQSTSTVGTFTIVKDQAIIIPALPPALFTGGSVETELKFGTNTISFRNRTETSQLGSGSSSAKFYIRIVDSSSALPDFTTVSPSLILNNTGLAGSSMFTLSHIVRAPDILDLFITGVLIPAGALIAFTIQFN